MVTVPANAAEETDRKHRKIRPRDRLLPTMRVAASTKDAGKNCCAWLTILGPSGNLIIDPVSPEYR